MSHNMTTAMPRSLTDTEIPVDACKHLLPHHNMSVIEFMKFSLPMPQLNTTFTNPNQYLSPIGPNIIDIQDIQHLRTPPTPIVESLVKAIVDPSVHRSVQCPHMGTTDGKKYPLWVIRYWAELIPIRTVHQKWANADESLRMQNQSQEGVSGASDPALVHKVYEALSTVSWTENIQGFSVSIPTHYLADYTTKEWMTDEHITQMLDLLQQDVIQAGLSKTIEIKSVWFLTMLRKGYEEQEQYMTHTSYRWLRALGQAFGTGTREQLAFIGLVGGNHWIAVVIDFKEGTVYYGDSLGEGINSSLRAILDWWIHLHTNGQFDHRNLPITLQQDGYSCGILAWLALVTFLLRGKYLLVDASRVAEERLKVLVRVVEKHQGKKVCYILGSQKLGR
jgi:hypothetical protein